MRKRNSVIFTLEGKPSFLKKPVKIGDANYMKTEIRKVNTNKIGIWKIMFACGKELLPYPPTKVFNCKTVSLLQSSGCCENVILQRPMVKITQFLCPKFTSNNFAWRKVETLVQLFVKRRSLCLFSTVLSRQNICTVHRGETINQSQVTSTNVQF